MSDLVLKKMSFTNAFKRMGKQRCRITFTIRVQSLSISSTESLHVEDEVNVLFERGEKSVSTGAMSLSVRNGGMLTTTFNQTLTLDATMWRDNNGVYADKVGKLTVRQRKNNSFGGGYKILGMTFLQLHSILNTADQQKTLRLPLQICGSEFSELIVTVSGCMSNSQNDSEFSIGSGDDCNSSIASTSSFRKAVGTTASAVPSATENANRKANQNRLTSTVNTKPVVPPRVTAAAAAAASTSSITQQQRPQQQDSPNSETVTTSWSATRNNRKPSTDSAVDLPFPASSSQSVAPPLPEQRATVPLSSMDDEKSSDDDGDDFRKSKPQLRPAPSRSSLGSLQLPKNKSNNNNDDNSDDDEWQPDFSGTSAAAAATVPTPAMKSINARMTSANSSSNGAGGAVTTLLPPPPKDTGRTKPTPTSAMPLPVASPPPSSSLNKYQQFMKSSPIPPPAPVVIVAPSKGGIVSNNNNNGVSSSSSNGMMGSADVVAGQRQKDAPSDDDDDGNNPFAFNKRDLWPAVSSSSSSSSSSDRGVGSSSGESKVPTDGDGFEDEYSEDIGFVATDNGWGKGPTTAGKEIKVSSSSSLPPPALKSYDSKLEKLQQEVLRLREENNLLRVASSSTAPSSSMLGNTLHCVAAPRDTTHSLRLQYHNA